MRAAQPGQHAALRVSAAARARASPGRAARGASPLLSCPQRLLPSPNRAQPAALGRLFHNATPFLACLPACRFTHCLSCLFAAW